MMAYAHSLWNFSMMNNPRIPMSCPVLIVNNNSTVIGSVPQASPNPTSIRMIFVRNIFKEEFWTTKLNGKMGGHMTIFSPTSFRAKFSSAKFYIVREDKEIFIALQALRNHIHLSCDLMKEQTESVRLLIIRAAGTRFANRLLHARQAEAI